MGILNSKSVDDKDILHESSKSVSYRYLSFKNEHKDEFNLIWLDETSDHNSLDSLRTKMLLLEINNNDCLFFDDADQFLIEIEKIRNENMKLLVIISGSFAKQILSLLKDI